MFLDVSERYDVFCLSFPCVSLFPGNCLTIMFKNNKICSLSVAKMSPNSPDMFPKLSKQFQKHPIVSKTCPKYVQEHAKGHERKNTISGLEFCSCIGIVKLHNDLYIHIISATGDKCSHSFTPVNIGFLTSKCTVQSLLFESLTLLFEHDSAPLPCLHML